MLRVGLTGGIGSGKSTVCHLFSEYGVAILDADKIGRELVQPGQPALDLIQSEFGSHILATDGTLNRALLRKQVFTDPDARHRLEAIMHPRILNTMLDRQGLIDAAYCIFAIPLLLEARQQDAMDHILVVDAPDETRIQRVMTRDGLEKTEIEAIIATQVPRAERLAAANDIIDNASNQTALAPQIGRLHQRFLQIAGNP